MNKFYWLSLFCGFALGCAVHVHKTVTVKEHAKRDSKIKANVAEALSKPARR